MLEAKNISTGYDKKQVLFDVSFTVNDNEVVLLTGGNGSGKSTVLKCIYGLLPKWNKEAKVTFNSKNISSIETSKLVNEGIVYIPQKNNYFETLTVYENLFICGSKNYKSDKELKQKIEEILKLPNLNAFRNRTPFNLSAGERQILALGNALMHKPKIILFDEPFAGLDNSNTNLLVAELFKLKQQNISMLIVEHDDTIFSLADKTINLYLGKLT